MKEKLRNAKGITLIALVVTIIILLILAGVTINVALGENGLFIRSKESAEKHKEELAKEKVSMTLAEYMLDISNVEMTNEERENKLKEILSTVGPIEATESYIDVEVDGYIIRVDKNTLKVESQGPSQKIFPTEIAVKPSSSNIEVAIGETSTIEVELTPANASKMLLKYTSSNEGIATVTNGVVKGITKGTATITIESTENSSIKATCEVTVKEVEAESISLDKTELELGKGETSEALNVTFNPRNATNKDIVWTSSNNEIATVSTDGKVTGVASGEVTITATTTNGKTATCTVTVIASNVGVIQNGIYRSIDGKKIVNLSEVNEETGLQNVADYLTLTTDFNCNSSIRIGESDYDLKSDFSLLYIDFEGKYAKENSVFLIANQGISINGNDSKLYQDTSLPDLFYKLNPLVPNDWVPSKVNASFGNLAQLLTNAELWQGFKSGKDKYGSSVIFGGPSVDLMLSALDLMGSSLLERLILNERNIQCFTNPGFKGNINVLGMNQISGSGWLTGGYKAATCSLHTDNASDVWCFQNTSPNYNSSTGKWVYTAGIQFRGNAPCCPVVIVDPSVEVGITESTEE